MLGRAGRTTPRGQEGWEISFYDKFRVSLYKEPDYGFEVTFIQKGQNLLIDVILSVNWYRMRKSYMIMPIIVLIFSLPFTYGGCSGSGGSKSPAEDAGIDVKLNVPYVPNHGNTCVTSSFTMVLKYYGTGAEFADVWNVVGYPADYDAFDYWIRNDYDLRLELLSDQIVDDIIHYIDEGFPVVVIQQHSYFQPIGHARVVIGYNLTHNQFIVHDPSYLGPNYRMSFELFVELWEYLTDYLEPWWEPTPTFLIIPIDDPIP